MSNEMEIVYDRSNKNEKLNFTIHYLKNKLKGSTPTSIRLAGKFPMTFSRGLFFEESESGSRKLKGRAEIPMSDEKALAFFDHPKRGAKEGWVKESEVTMIKFNTLKNSEEIKCYTGPDESEISHTIPAGTVMNSNEHDEESGFYNVTYGGGEKGVYQKFMENVADVLWKNRKRAKINAKSAKEILSQMKHPLKSEDENDFAYFKISYRPGADGWIAKFNTAIREDGKIKSLTLDELLNNKIVGIPEFTVSGVYQGGSSISIQVYLSSMFVLECSPIERFTPQKELIDQYAADPEFVEKMKAQLSSLTRSSPEKITADENSKVEDIVAPSMEKIAIDDSDGSDEEDLEDVKIPGID